MPNLGRKAALNSVRLTCLRCSKEFTPWRKDQKYCGSECRLFRALSTLTCRREACGIEFTPMHGNQAYCSGACRQQSWLDINRSKLDRRSSREQNAAGSQRWSTTVWWRLFRISEEDAYRMIHEQDNKCSSCQVEFIWGESKGKGSRAFVLDHCHLTGVGRGIICSRCNRILGLAGDDPDVLRRAAEYLVSPPMSIAPRSFVEPGGDCPGS